MRPRRTHSSRSAGVNALPCILKSDMLNSNTVRSVWRTIFCWARLPDSLLPSSLRMMVISFSENFFLPIVAVLVSSVCEIQCIKKGVFAYTF